MYTKFIQFNFLSIILAVIAQFFLGFVWYGPLFGKLWGKIHGFDKLSEEQQQKLMNSMGPIYLIQFLVTIITTIVLNIFVVFLPRDWNVYALAGFFWFGFVVSAQVSSVMFSETPKKWMFTKVLLQAGASLLCLEVAAIILNLL